MITVFRRGGGSCLRTTMFNGELNEVMPQTTPRGTDGERQAVGIAGRILDRHHLARQPLAFLGREQQRLNRAADLVIRVGYRKSGLGDDSLHEVLPPFFDQRRRVVKDLIAALAVEEAHARAARGVNRVIHLLACRARDLPILPVNLS